MPRQVQSKNQQVENDEYQLSQSSKENNYILQKLKAYAPEKAQQIIQGNIDRENNQYGNNKNDEDQEDNPYRMKQNFPKQTSQNQKIILNQQQSVVLEAPEKEEISFVTNNTPLKSSSALKNTQDDFMKRMEKISQMLSANNKDQSIENEDRGDKIKKSDQIPKIIQQQQQQQEKQIQQQEHQNQSQEQPEQIPDNIKNYSISESMVKDSGVFSQQKQSFVQGQQQQKRNASSILLQDTGNVRDSMAKQNLEEIQNILKNSCHNVQPIQQQLAQDKQQKLSQGKENEIIQSNTNNNNVLESPKQIYLDFQSFKQQQQQQDQQEEIDQQQKHSRSPKDNNNSNKATSKSMKYSDYILHEQEMQKIEEQYLKQDQVKDIQQQQQQQENSSNKKQQQQQQQQSNNKKQAKSEPDFMKFLSGVNIQTLFSASPSDRFKSKSHQQNQQDSITNKLCSNISNNVNDQIKIDNQLQQQQQNNINNINGSQDNLLLVNNQSQSVLNTSNQQGSRVNISQQQQFLFQNSSPSRDNNKKQVYTSFLNQFDHVNSTMVTNSKQSQKAIIKNYNNINNIQNNSNQQQQQQYQKYFQYSQNVLQQQQKNIQYPQQQQQQQLNQQQQQQQLQSEENESRGSTSTKQQQQILQNNIKNISAISKSKKGFCWLQYSQLERSQVWNQRKKENLQQIKQERNQEFTKHCTFQPSTNRNKGNYSQASFQTVEKKMNNQNSSSSQQLIQQQYSGKQDNIIKKQYNSNIQQRQIGKNKQTNSYAKLDLQRKMFQKNQGYKKMSHQNLLLPNNINNNN